MLFTQACHHEVCMLLTYLWTQEVLQLSCKSQILLSTGPLTVVCCSERLQTSVIELLPPEYHNGLHWFLFFICIWLHHSTLLSRSATNYAWRYTNMAPPKSFFYSLAKAEWPPCIIFPTCFQILASACIQGRCLVTEIILVWFLGLLVKDWMFLLHMRKYVIDYYFCSLFLCCKFGP